MTADQKLGEIANILQGGFGGFGVAGAMPSSHSSELYRAVPRPDLLQTIGMAVAGLTGTSVAPLPRVAHEQGVGEAIYAFAVNARIWEQMQQHAVTQMAQGIGYNIGQIGNTMGLPKMLGMSTTGFQHMVDRGLGSAVGLGIVGQLANMPAMHRLMGGNVMGTYQTAFAYRNLFGQPLGFGHPMDSASQERATDYSMALNDKLMQAALGTPGGGIGLMPNFNFTRGFSVNDIQSLMVRLQQGGRWRAGDDIDSRVADTGGMTRAFEALGDFMGSRDMDQLTGAMTKLTQGRWERLDSGQLTRGLRELQSMAHVLGRSKEEMVSTVTQIQSALQGGIGIGASQLAMGVTAGGYGGFAASGRMAAEVYAVAAARGQNRPEDINRIMMQRVALHNMGMNSYAGRAASLAAYMHQEGMLGREDYETAVRGLTYGDAGGKISVVNDLLRRKFGSEAEGMARLNDPRYMTMIRAATDDAPAAAVEAAIRTGQIMEWGDRALSAGRSGLGRALSGIQGQMGVSGALGGNDAVAGAKADAVFSFFATKRQNTSATFLKSVYENALASGKSRSEAYSLMMARMRGNVGQEYWGGAEAAAQKAGLGAGLDAVNAGGVTGADANAILQGLRSTGAFDTFSDETKSEFYEAQKQLSKGDYTGALSAAKTLLGNASPEAQAVINERRGVARSQATDAVAEANRRAESLNRFERGIRMGLSAGGVGVMQSAFTKHLTAIDAKLRGGGSMDEARKMIVAGLGEESGKDLTKAQRRMRDYLGTSVVDKLFKAKTPEDVSNLLKEQRAIEVWDKTTRSAAAEGRNVPIEIAETLSAGEEEFMAEADIRGMTISAAVMNQAAADTGQGLRANTGQLALGVAQGKISPLRMLGLSDDSMRHLDAGTWARVWQWEHKSKRYVKNMGTANDKVQAAMEGVLEDAVGASDGGDAVGGMVSDFQTKVGSGTVSLKDPTTFIEFMDEHSNVPEATRDKMWTLYRSMQESKTASEEYLKHQGKLDKLQPRIAAGVALESAQKAKAQERMEATGGAYLDSGLSILGTMGTFDLEWKWDRKNIEAVSYLSGKPIWRTTADDARELARKYSTRESLSTLDAEGMRHVANLYLDRHKKFNTGNSGVDGAEGTKNIRGTITLIDGDTKRTGLVNFSEG